jgi:ribosome-interacting GTPase 1
MPANLPPQYFEAEKRYRQASSDDEKLKILQEMLAIMPKHKGTDKLQGDLKSRISKLRKVIATVKKSGKSGLTYNVDREGSGQLILLGLPNSGKSQLLKSLTHAHPEVASYPFTTRIPQPGMMPFENIQIQLVDTPPINQDFFEGWLTSIIRNSDGALLLIDLSSEDFLEQAEIVMKKLEQNKIILVNEPNRIDPETGNAYVQTILLANKIDSLNALENFGLLKELYQSKFLLIPISAQKGNNLEELKQRIYEMLRIIRVYTKEPGKPADFEDPIILKKNGTVIDAALSIHKDFAHQLKYARIWGKGKYQGQMVQRDGVLQDGDIIEFHI